MSKAQPFAMTLSSRTLAWVEEEASRLGRSRCAIVEALAVEAARMRRFPGIAFRALDYAQRAWLIGTAFDVWEIVEAYQAMGPRRMMEEGDLQEREISLALAYYHEYPEEVDQAIHANRVAKEKLRHSMGNEA
ncbi:MAG TPA: hypothetical protein VLA19_23075 [Herpetosiphonaceae bacterium]|nr:hypothetical protein [Herpetosiphonaceae bacterium]